MEVNRYNTIIELGDSFISLIGKGIIPVSILDWKVYYEAYLIQLKEDKKTEAVETVAAQFDISRRHLFNIIRYMESA